MGYRYAISGFVLLVFCIGAVLPPPEVSAEGLSYISSDPPNVITSVPREMSFQGVLKDAGGDPVADSVYNVTFRIYNVEFGGTSMWDETVSCTTSTGIFNAILSNVNLSFSEDYWLEMEIDSEILEPRKKINMAGYAAVSDTADFARMAKTDCWKKETTVISLFAASDSVGIGTDTPTEKLEVDGKLKVSEKATIGPGNTNTGICAFVAGENNTASDTGTTVGGGYNNTAEGLKSTVSGGHGNTASGIYSVVGGGNSNVASGVYTTTGGGITNTASGSYSTVAGGQGNTANSSFSTVGGGYSNEAGPNSTVCGGYNNTATNENSSAVCGGENNEAYRRFSFIGGGTNNFTQWEWSVIGGGWGNQTHGARCTIAGGEGNVAGSSPVGHWASVGGGWDNTASGQCSYIPGGCHNVASGDFSMAVGSGAKALHNGSFVWSDASNDEFESTGDNQVMMLASGGTWIYSDPDLSSGVTIHPGASAWATYSSLDLKENLRPIDGRNILQKISSLNIKEWNFKAQNDDVTHMGPSSQDFYDAFGLGESNETISTIDADGVALAGIQALLEKIEQLENRIAELEAERK